MRSGPHFRMSLVTAREQLAEGRKKLKEQHARGSPGVQVCASLTVLLDAIVLKLFEAALEDLDDDGPHGLREHVALVPHGGYGRRSVAPYSDVDLMILHSGGASDRVTALAKRLTHDIYDVGLDLGHSVRTPAEACQLARGDVTICTSLLEARLLVGNAALFEQFQSRLAKMTERRSNGLHESFVSARREERAQFGETVYLLEPNVKRSRGGLRDIHLLRWLGFLKFGEADLAPLQRLGALSKEDVRRLNNASEFLLRLRNEMHFHDGKAHDVLDRAEQVRVAELFGYRSGKGLLPVERFMREYFRHTMQVRNLVTRFVESVRPTTAVTQVLAPMFSRALEGDFRLGRKEISATPQGLDKLKSELNEVLRLADLASLHNRRIARSTWVAVYRAGPKYSDDISEEVASRFLSLLTQTTRLGELLRQLHELGVLEKIIPAFARARCLLQFNKYHKYTVDEHCIRAVQCATEFISDEGPLGAVCRQIKRRRTLHLALLLHDLGKGHEEDHSDVGLQIATDVAERLRLPEREAEMVKFLVHKHLLMSHLAFRRDTSDDQLIVRFAVEVGSPEVLQMLFVLTCADLAAVGPGVLNRWKVEVLTDLYNRTMHHLAGSSATDSAQKLDSQRSQVRACLSDEGGEGDAEWFDAQIDTLPSGYLSGFAPESVAGTLRRLRRLQSGAADAWARYLPESQTLEFFVGIDQGRGRGVFYRLTGALASKGIKILSAEIQTLPGELVLDRFVVEDLDFSGEPTEERLESVCQALVTSVQSEQPPKIRKVWGERTRPSHEALSSMPTQVRIDNNTSEKYSIIDVFTFDRMGLLYTIARTLYELELSVGVARIGTYLDQVVDVFYVTDQGGGKIVDEDRLGEIRRRLHEAIDVSDESS